ncbi:MAG: hypothetical protein R3B47_20655 [Bacteroidia bacterium]
MARFFRQFGVVPVPYFSPRKKSPTSTNTMDTRVTLSRQPSYLNHILQGTPRCAGAGRPCAFATTTGKSR